MIGSVLTVVGVIGAVFMTWIATRSSARSATRKKLIAQVVLYSDGAAEPQPDQTDWAERATHGLN